MRLEAMARRQIFGRRPDRTERTLRVSAALSSGSGPQRLPQAAGGARRGVPVKNRSDAIENSYLSHAPQVAEWSQKH